MTLLVRRARVEEIRPLRHAVLRPGYPPQASIYPEDEEAVHVGAWDGTELVGCATVFPEAWPGPPEEPQAWRLRGMAVVETRQGTGAGRQVLEAAVAAAWEAGAPLLWANARSSALGFYLRAGWEAIGDEFLTSDPKLPHRRIRLVRAIP